MTDTTKELKALKQETLDMAKHVADHLTVVEGEIKVDEATYIKSLPEGITEDTIKKIQEHNSVFFPAAEHAVGSAMFGLYQNDAELKDQSTKIKLVGKDTFEVSSTRERRYPDMIGRKNGNPEAEIVKHMVISSDLTTHAAQNGGEIKLVRAHLSAEAAKAFGSL